MQYLSSLSSSIWHIPDGFATLIAGILAISGAFVAWLSIKNQISAQKEIENNRQGVEIQALKTALTAELLVFSIPIIDATSKWNSRAKENPQAEVKIWPRFVHPKVYDAEIGKLGLLSEGWPAMAAISFYGILYQIHELGDKKPDGPETIGVNVGWLSERLRMMSMNLAEALDGLNGDKPIQIPPEIELSKLIAPNGYIIGDDKQPPRTIQELLLRLGLKAE